MLLRALHAQVYADAMWLCSAGCRWSSTWMKTPSRRGWSFSSLKTKGQVSKSDRRYQEILLSSKREYLTLADASRHSYEWLKENVCTCKSLVVQLSVFGGSITCRKMRATSSVRRLAGNRLWWCPTDAVFPLPALWYVTTTVQRKCQTWLQGIFAVVCCKTVSPPLNHFDIDAGLWWIGHVMTD